MIGERFNLRPCYNVIVLDDDYTLTGDLEGLLPPEDLAALVRFETVYAYDSREVTYLCEMTPSYTLYPIECREVFRYGYEPETDAANQLAVESMGYDPIYVHVRDIELRIGEFKGTGEPWRYRKIGSMGLRHAPKDYEALIDRVVQPLRESPVI